MSASLLVRLAPNSALLPNSRCGRRFLSIHEYQSMGLLAQYKVPIPRGQVAKSAEEAARITQTLGADDVVVKAQVLAGGRGKGVFDNGFKGGVHLAQTPDEVKQLAQQMIGRKLITKQTGPTGRPCNQVLICERLFYRKEFYLAILLDRITAGPMLVGSRHGGMDIEKVAADDPTSIIQCPIPSKGGIDAADLKQFFNRIGIASKQHSLAEEVVRKLFKLFVEKDATLVEINPLVESTSGKLVCVDAKLGFDDNAEFRQKELFALRDITQEDAREVEATKANLNYIGLYGNIGCLVNGAGLAMATMDLIKHHGGEPANFLDVGGSATAEQVTKGLCIIGSDPTVHAILINIFGGIMRCDVIAQGVLDAVSKGYLKVPVVVRLQGTKVEEAKSMISKANANVFFNDDLNESAIKSVKLAKIVELARQANVKISIVA